MPSYPPVIPYDTTFHSAYLVDLTNISNRIVFVYTPRRITERKSADYANVPVLGRSEPVVAYSGSGPRIINLTLYFAQHETTTEREVISQVNLLRSWEYPNYNDIGTIGDSPVTVLPNNLTSIPSVLLLVWGSWLSQRVILTHLTIEYLSPWLRVPTDNFVVNAPDGPVLVEGPPRDPMYPFLVEANLVLQEVNRKPFGRVEIESDGGKTSNPLTVTVP